MSDRHVDPEAVLAGLKEFQRRTARWTFQRMFDRDDPARRFLVADEVGLGKTHVAKGVVAQVIDHLQSSGDERHDIVYVCSNGAIARQNLRKLVPRGIEPLEDVERLTMLPLAELDQGTGARSGVNLLAITPGTSLKFGRSTGRFPERCLAYAFLRAHWGADVMSPRARWIFWKGISPDDADWRLRDREMRYRSAVTRSLVDFAHQVAETDKARAAHHRPSIRDLFNELTEGLKWKRYFPEELESLQREFIGEIRRMMAIVGISALRPDLVILDEFQRFKDLLHPDPDNFAAELAHRLFDYVDPETGRPTRTLLLSATPYRMYTTDDEQDSDHYADFISTCSFLFAGDASRVRQLQRQFNRLRAALTSPEGMKSAEAVCNEIGAELRAVMARTERLAATPDRDGMLAEPESAVRVERSDLGAYLRVGDLAEAVDHHEPTEYWKAAPYLVNFMERYKLKEAVTSAIEDGTLPDRDHLEPGPGLLRWSDIEAYADIDPQNGRLRWLLEDLARHRAFDLLWIPPSLRYYDANSIYESEEAGRLTKRLIFSGWAVVPKVVSALTSFESERHAYTSRNHTYTAEHRQRGGQRLTFRTSERATHALRPGEAESERRAAAMTTFLLIWPSVTLARLGDPRALMTEPRRTASEVIELVEARLEKLLKPLVSKTPTEGVVDRRWYWAAPLLLDTATRQALLETDPSLAWGVDGDGAGFRTHLAEARAMVSAGVEALGRTPDDLTRVLAEVALGGPAQCALRAVTSVTGLAAESEASLFSAARVASAFRRFFNAPEVTGIVLVSGDTASETDEAATARYWRDVVAHCIDGNLQAALDEHCHVLRDWLGFVGLDEDDLRGDAASQISERLAEALDVRTSVFRVDIPRRHNGRPVISIDEHRMRSRFAVAFGNQALDEGGEARVESVSTAFNSPFWPFVMTSTSVGQEGLDFHLWSHAVVHWNLPANPVDLEQREGRVHRYKGHAIRRNVAAAVGAEAVQDGLSCDGDLWDRLFELAASDASDADAEMVPYWVFHGGPARIERHVPVLPYSRDGAMLPKLRKTLASYRLAFGQPRQEELVEFLGADRTDADLIELASRLKIDLAPPA
ncbi:MAG: DEAD/DEAH box helicase [Actinomycetota bacterium]|nr:DEAD/DEAH box helicase [Actinomycetota bacterium]